MTGGGQAEPIDVVYTWVDDALPGYREALLAHAAGSGDSSPDRTRDNLGLLRYSMRSLERFVPWIRRVVLVKHMPLLIERESWTRMIDKWTDDFRRTSASRFRGRANVVPEHLYPHFLLAEGLGTPVPLATAYARAAYHGLDNLLPLQWLGTRLLRALRPKFYCLNDNFPARPSPRVETLVGRWLERWYPEPSRWERR